MFFDTVEAFSHAFCYVILAFILLALGYLMSDVLMPGKLGAKGQQLLERNVNVAVMTASHLIATTTVISASIWVTHAELGKGLLMTAVFGVLGIAVLGLIELAIDKLTPGTSQTLFADRFQPIIGIVSLINILFGVIIAVSIL